MLSNVTNIAAGALSITAPVTAASSTVALTDNIARNANVIRVVNAGAKTVFIRWYNDDAVAAQAATITDIPLLAGSVEQFVIGNADAISLICGGADSSTVYITPVQGI